MEDDAEEFGVGRSYLSVQARTRVHSCAFFPHRFTPVEQNYTIVAVKLVLKDHWLNLIFVQQTKRLNACQTCSALFFEWFQFTLSYELGSKNIKPAALSCE